MAPAVDLVVNTFERSYRSVLAPGFFPAIAEQNCFRFARRVALINNVTSPDDAVRRAQALVDAGELDEYHRVAARLPEALAVTQPEPADLQRFPHYTDCSLVAVTLLGSPFLLYWDADIHLDEPHDWITPSVELMEQDGSVLVCSPRWTGDVNLERQTMYRSGSFALGWGFSDQLYLVRRADLARPIYRERCSASLRFPLSAVRFAFEARVDAYMRHHGRLRGVYLNARYSHPIQPPGTGMDRFNRRERVRRARNLAWLKLIELSPVKKACWRYF